MKINIITDSSSDFSLKEAEELGITLIPLTLNIDGKDYKDGVDISKEEFYDLLINQHKMPKTAQPSIKVFEEIFKKAKENNEIALVIPIGKSFSGTYNNALIAKEIIDYKHIYIIDSCTTIGGLQILVKHALKLIDEGKDIADIVDSLNLLKTKIVMIAIMNTLDYLVKGGRLSTAKGLIGNLLNLKPMITFTYDGSISILNKSFGNLRANIQMIKHIKENPIDDSYPICYYYSYNKANLETFIDKLKRENLFKEGKTINLSPVVGCHIGDNAYAIVYVKK